MFVELVDQLRCPAPHEETWLVLFADEARDRHVLEGSLGCPVCGARYPVRGGTAWFITTVGALAGTPAGAPAGPVAPADDWPVRLAAFLDLTDARGMVGLYGAWATYAEPLGDVVEQLEVVAVAPLAATHPMLSGIVPPSRTAIPLASGSLRAVALDRPSDAAADAAAEAHEAARLIRTGGRLLAPASTPVPPGITELARDAAWWVGQRDAAPSGVVTIAGRRREAPGSG